MSIKLTKKTVILLIIAVLLLAASAILSAISRRRAAPAPAPAVTDSAAVESASATSEEPIADITGDWYSNREKGDHLRLYQDHTFTSDWLGSGTYTQSGSTLSLSGTLGLSAELTYDSDTDTLQYTGSREAAHTYYRTEQKVSEAQAAQQEADRSSDAAQTAHELLTAGVWESYTLTTPQEVLATLTFTDSSFTVSRLDIDETYVYLYVIDRAVSDNGELDVFISFEPMDDTQADGGMRSGTFIVLNKGDGVLQLTDVNVLQGMMTWTKRADAA